MFNGSNCQKIERTAPGLCVYKTKGDYFNYVSITMEDGRIIFMPDYYNSARNSIDSRLEITETDTIYTGRFKLINGYIISEETTKNSVFVDFTFAEYLRYDIEHPGDDGGITRDVLLDNILDDDPFLELFYDSNRPRKYGLSDTSLVNQIIRDGELEKYFDRLK